MESRQQITPSVTNPLQIIIPVIAMLVLISVWAQWYGNQVSLPRYCGNPSLAINHLEQVLLKKQPAGGESRRPYIIAAKLLFLLPMQNNELIPDYLKRVERHLLEAC